MTCSGRAIGVTGIVLDKRYKIDDNMKFKILFLYLRGIKVKVSLMRVKISKYEWAVDASIQSKISKLPQDG